MVILENKAASEVRAQNKLQLGKLFKRFKAPADLHIAPLDGRHQQAPFLAPI